MYTWNDGTGKDYIAHHGILGQKWGIRRYQNPDGTLTEAGKKRYGGLGTEKGNLRWVDKTAMRRSASKIVYFGTQEPGKNQKEVLNSYRKEANESKYEKKLNELDKEGRKLYEEGKRIQVSGDKKAEENFMKKYNNWRNEYEKNQVANTIESQQIAKKYVAAMNEALVKDLDFKDVETGSNYLTTMNLGWNASTIYDRAWF